MSNYLVSYCKPSVSQEINKKINKMFKHIENSRGNSDLGTKSAYNAYRLDAIIRAHNDRLFQNPHKEGVNVRDFNLERNKTIDRKHKSLFDLHDFDIEEKDDSKEEFLIDDKNISKIENNYSRDETNSINNLHKDLRISIDSAKKSKLTNRTNKSNESKMTMNFLAVSREKNQKRQYFDWTNKPMLFINQNEVEPKRRTESMTQLPQVILRPQMSKSTNKYSKDNDFKARISADINPNEIINKNNELNDLSKCITRYFYYDYNKIKGLDRQKFVSIEKEANDQLLTPAQRRQELNNVKILMEHRGIVSKEINFKKKRERII